MTASRPARSSLHLPESGSSAREPNSSILNPLSPPEPCPRVEDRLTRSYRQPFELLFMKPCPFPRNAPVPLNQKHRGNVGQAEGIAGRVVVLIPIEQAWQFNAKRLRKPKRGRSVVLRNWHNPNLPSGDPLQVGQSQLADRTAYLKVRQKHRPIGEQAFEGMPAPCDIEERYLGRQITNFQRFPPVPRHLSLSVPSSPGSPPARGL